MEWSPPITLTHLATAHGKIAVVRDDLLIGGTKQRAAIPFLKAFQLRGFNEFVYASPFSGFAQVALSASCTLVGAKCTIFAEADPKTKQISSASTTAQKYANVQLFDSLAEAEAKALIYAGHRRQTCRKMPLGLNDRLYRLFLRRELLLQWQRLCTELGYIPHRLWVPVGSGTLAEVFHSIIPESTKLACVDVKVLPESDKRIVKIRSLRNAEYKQVPEMFAQPVTSSPPVPSNQFYDAKLWQFINAFASDNEVWWNVAC